MRELNHRSKNMLTLVQAIASQTGGKTAPEFVAQFGERIHSLAASQDILVRNQWKSADLGELVRSQLAHFADLFGTRIHVEGPPVPLTSAAAQTIGMALHELATNAAKYGALRTERGEIDITWRTDPAVQPEHAFCIEWREHGGPSVKRSSHKGFGSKVLVTMAEMGLGATVDLDPRPEGLRWRMACPLDSIVSRN